ncbi:hypothetical protein [Aureimonas sp. ME7]|nr:hypothetical protein [Aureimonas sp. ME7]
MVADQVVAALQMSLYGPACDIRIGLSGRFANRRVFGYSLSDMWILH